MRRCHTRMARLMLMAIVAWSMIGAQETIPGRSPRFFFATSSRAVPVELKSAPVLRRLLSVQFAHVTLQDALAEISRQANIQFMYKASVVPMARRMTLRADGITLAAVLTQVLQDTDLDVVFSPDGPAALVPRDRNGMTVAATGIVTGRVTERGTNVPVASVQVTLGGIGRPRYTDEKGQYRFPDVPAGEHEITARRVGFEAASRKVAVNEGETVTVDFAMARVATTLTEVVTTAAGERSRLEVGNSIGTIKADSLVPTTLIRNVSDLLQARMPGVIVSNGTGRVGGSSKIRIRGISSLTLNNDPIIVLDGVRLNWLSTSATGVGGSSTSQTTTGLKMALSASNAGQLTNRLDDLDPNTIESIDVLRGPSAATLYGTEAANGVIVIKTKKGTVGPWHANLLADDGWSTYGRYPAEYVAWGVDYKGSVRNLQCYGPLGAGLLTPCQIDSVSGPFNGNNDPNLASIGTGTARNVSVSLSGGSQQLQEFLSIRGSDQVGVEKLPEVEQRRIQQMWGMTAPSWMVRPNTEQDWDGSSRTTVRVSPTLDLQLSAQGIYRSVQGAQGIASNGSGYKAGPWDTLSFLPAEFEATHGTGVIKRAVTSVTTNYVPLSWLTLTAALGGDYTLRADNRLLAASTCTVLLAPGTGCPSSHTNDRGETFVTTANVGAQLSFSPRPWLGLRTAFGEQYSGTTFYELNAGNTGSTNLAFGTDLLTPSPVATSGTPQLFTVTETRDQSASAGYYVEQTVALRERLFVTGAFRQDAASAFGALTNRHLPTYPKFSLSWLASDESFFPWKDIISSFRLRAAYGHSGNQARQTDRLPNYSVATVLGDTPTPVQGLVLQGVPNPLLKPERSIETEGGFDLSLLTNERLHLEATLYRKISKDAIVVAPVPGSYGSLSANLSQNIGSVENRGVELSVTAKVVDSRTFGWDLTANFSENHNKLVSINAMSSQINRASSYMWGYPLFGVWRFTSASYADLNGDGVLEGNEISLSTGTPGIPAGVANGSIFLGPPYPKGEFTYNNDFSLFSGMIRVTVLFNQVRDLLVLSQAFGTQCSTDAAACTLAQQAEVITTSQNANTNVDKASYLRFSELSVTAAVPQAMARRVLHTRSAAVTFAGRNLAIWSNYIWKDPAQTQNVGTETAASGGQANGLGQPRTWTVRLNMEF